MDGAQRPMAFRADHNIVASLNSDRVRGASQNACRAKARTLGFASRQANVAAAKHVTLVSANRTSGEYEHSASCGAANCSIAERIDRRRLPGAIGVGISARDSGPIGKG